MSIFCIFHLKDAADQFHPAVCLINASTSKLLVLSKLGLAVLKSGVSNDDTMGFSKFSCKMKLHLINLCLQARIDFYNQQKEEQKANRAKYREKVRRQNV